VLAYDQAHFSALVSMEQRENAKEQGAKFSVCLYCFLVCIIFTITWISENESKWRRKEVQTLHVLLLYDISEFSNLKKKTCNV
jgi:hypothetical protein